MALITARRRSLRRLRFHSCLSVHRGVSAPLHTGNHIPPGQTDADNPSGQTTHQCMLGYGQQAGGTHPTGMHSC